jgi:hypothetical protein
VSMVIGLAGCHWVFPYTTAQGDGSARDSTRDGVSDGPERDQITSPPWTRFIIAQDTGSTTPYAEPAGLGRDASGNLYVAVSSYGTIAIDSTSSIASVKATGDPSLLLLSYSPVGDLRWQHLYTSTDHLDPRALDVRGDRVYTVGLFLGTSTIGDQTYAASGYQHVLLLVHDLDGAVEKVRLFKPSGANAQGQAIGVSDSGRVAIGGLYGKGVDLGCGALPDVTSPVESGFAAVLKPDLSCLWSRDIATQLLPPTPPGEMYNRANTARVTDSGDSFFAGIVVGTSDLGNKVVLEPTDGIDLFYAAYSSDGTPSFGRAVGSAKDDAATAAAATPDGGWIVVGTVAGDVDYGDSLKVQGLGADDALVMKVSATGVHWAKHLGGAGNDHASAVVVGADGTIHVAGCFSGKATFDGFDLTAAGGIDAFVVALDGDGSVKRARQLGGTDGDECATGIVESSGALIVSGSFQGSTAIGSASATSAGVSGFVHLLPP